MLWVLIRSASLRHFWWLPTTYVFYGELEKIINNNTHKKHHAGTLLMTVPTAYVFLEKKKNVNTPCYEKSPSPVLLGHLSLSAMFIEQIFSNMKMKNTCTALLYYADRKNSDLHVHSGNLFFSVYIWEKGVSKNQIDVCILLRIKRSRYS